MILLLVNLLISLSYGVSFLQESQDILCSNQNTQIFIDQRDRFIDVLNIKEGTKETYKSFEFLDSAILLKHPIKNSWAHIQLTPKNNAVLTMGSSINFKESQCTELSSAKSCKLEGQELVWSSTQLTLKTKYKKIGPIDVYHYGVYPNDGTYFVAKHPHEHRGLILIDFGSNLTLIHGTSHTLECRYK